MGAGGQTRRTCDLARGEDVTSAAATVLPRVRSCHRFKLDYQPVHAAELTMIVDGIHDRSDSATRRPGVNRRVIHGERVHF